jgi:hypothetical protein
VAREWNLPRYAEMMAEVLTRGKVALTRIIINVLQAAHFFTEAQASNLVRRLLILAADILTEESAGREFLHVG